MNRGITQVTENAASGYREIHRQRNAPARVTLAETIRTIKNDQSPPKVMTLEEFCEP